jgi:hypothetical protein
MYCPSLIIRVTLRQAWAISGPRRKNVAPKQQFQYSRKLILKILHRKHVKNPENFFFSQKNNLRGGEFDIII